MELPRPCGTCGGMVLEELNFPAWMIWEHGECYCNDMEDENDYTTEAGDE